MTTVASSTLHRDELLVGARAPRRWRHRHFAALASFAAVNCASLATAEPIAIYGNPKREVSHQDLVTATARLKPDVQQEYFASAENIRQLATRIALARERAALESTLSEAQRAQIELEGELARSAYARVLLDERAVADARQNNRTKDQRVAELYALRPEPCVAPATYTASHILVRTDDKPLVDAMRLITEVQTSINAGAKFEDLAKKYSADESSAVNGGKLPPFSKVDIDRLFAKEYFRDQTAGRVSPPFQTRYGFHILRVDGPGSNEKLLPLDQCKAALELMVDKEVSEKAVAKLEESLVAKAKVQINEAELSRRIQIAQQAAKAKTELIEKALREVDAQKTKSAEKPKATQ